MARNRKAESVECPCCSANAGENCQRVNGVEPGRSCPTHQSRVKLARVAATFCLQPGMVGGEFCVMAKGHAESDGHICRPVSQWPARPVLS